jgi:hypothetical protein
MKLTSMACYMLNNLAALQIALAVYPFTSRWVQVCVRICVCVSVCVCVRARARQGCHLTVALQHTSASETPLHSQRLASEAAVWEESLVQQAANDLLGRCGLLAKLTAMRAFAARGAENALPMSRTPGLAAEDLRPAVAAFYAELRLPTLFAVFEPVAHSKPRARLRRDMAAVLSAAHASVLDALRQPPHGYAADTIGPGGVATLSSSDVNVLLQLI